MIKVIKASKSVDRYYAKSQNILFYSSLSSHEAIYKLRGRYDKIASIKDDINEAVDVASTVLRAVMIYEVIGGQLTPHRLDCGQSAQEAVDKQQEREVTMRRCIKQMPPNLDLL